MSGQLLLLFGVFIIAAALRIPVFLAVCLSTVVYSIVYPVMPSVVLVQTLMQGLNKSAFTAIPFFFLVGAIMNAGGITARLIRLARALLGQFRGGLSHVNIGASVIFGGISGSAVADAAAVGSVMIPAMKRDGYSAPYSAAVTASSATIGLLIPPSIPMVLFGLFNNASIGDLFLAGVVPGLLMGIYLLFISGVIARRRGYVAHPWQGWGEIWCALRQASFALMLPIIVIGAMVGGIATVSEIGAVAVAYATVVSTLIHRDISFVLLWRTVKKTALDSAQILIIIAVAGGALWITANMGAADVLVESLLALQLSPFGMLGIVAVGLILVGTVVGPGLQLILIVPMLAPTLVASGLDILQVGVVCVLASALGLITPPVGILLYLTAAQARATVIEVVIEMLPFLAALIALLAILVFLPFLSTSLPASLA